LGGSPQMDCEACLRPLNEGGAVHRFGCGHSFHEACVDEFRELSAGSACPACSDLAGGVLGSQCSAQQLCESAAVEYVRAVRSTAAGSPARHVVAERCARQLKAALELDPSHPKSMVLMGMLHQAGLGVDKDHAAAVEFFVRADRAGDALGALHLARCYKHGLGCDPDLVRARELFGRADEGGNTMACLELALMCRSGLGGALDLPRAWQLFEKADRRGDALAAYELAVAYMNGSGGLARNEAKAREHMESAHDRGYAPATVELGQMCMAGVGGVEDAARASTLMMGMDFPRPKQEPMDDRAVREGWVDSCKARTLYKAELAKLKASGEWWQLADLEDEEDPNSMLKAAGLYVEPAKLPASNASAPTAHPPLGHAKGGVWRAAMSFRSINYGDVIEVSAPRAAAADGSRTVVNIEGGDVSIIAEYVLPADLGKFMRKQQAEEDDIATDGCSPFGGMSKRLGRMLRRSGKAGSGPGQR